MVFLHRPEFHRLLGSGRSVCRCPRPWLVNKARGTRTTHPWFILRRVEPDGGYDLLVRCRTFDQAIRMVYSLIQFDSGYARPENPKNPDPPANP